MVSNVCYIFVYLSNLRWNRW